MGKGHRDNHNARQKRGKKAFAKKTTRQKARADGDRNKCKVCGRKCRKKKLTLGACPICREAMSAKISEGD
ncbi:MAG: hypothetical protein NG712_04400 [Omnitrophica bacterium]|nr:hypothetical protein [Candidatus Omnitrophota bacterium]